MIKITTAQQGMGQQFANGARSWDAGLTDFQRAQLRSIEQGSGGQMQAYGSLNPNSMVNQRRAAMGVAPTSPSSMTANGMTSTGAGQAQPQPVRRVPAPQAPGVNRPAVQPTAATFGGVAEPRMGATGPQPGGAPGGVPAPRAMATSLAPGSSASFGGAADGEAPTTGLLGAEQAYRGGLNSGVGAVNQSLGMARGDVAGSVQGANSTLAPYQSAGGAANQYQAALSGALGGGAQQQAFDRFSASPGQQYLLDESERAIRRNASATGGLQGGNVQRALQENAIGLAAQDFDNSFNRLSTVSDRGFDASGQISGNQMAGGQLLSGLAQNAGNMNANMMYGTGQTLGAGRTRAGEMIADNVERSSTNLANILQGGAAGQSDVVGQGTINLSNLLAGSGKDSATLNTQLAQALAQIASSAGGQQAGVGSLGGTSQTDSRFPDIKDAWGWLF